MSAYDTIIAWTRGKVPWMQDMKDFATKTRDDIAVLTSGGLTNALVYGAREISSAVDITLTSADSLVQSVTMTAASKAVNMPDATTDVEGKPWTIYNAGTNAFAIKDNTGGIIVASVAAGDTVVVKLVDGATAAGVWIAATASASPAAATALNLFINASGLVNQRVYVSGTATTVANEYTLDRWRVVTSGQNLTFSSTANIVTMTAPAGGLEQVIEGKNIQSGTYTVKWTGTATCTVDGTAKSSGDTFNLTGGTDATIRFTNGTVKEPMVVAGTVAPSAFIAAGGGTYQSELDLCTRYYERWHQSKGDFQREDYLGKTISTTIAFFNAHYAPKRVAPTVAFSAASDWRVNGVTGIAIATSGPVHTSGTQIRITVAAGLTAYQPAEIDALTANQEISFDAEL